MLHDSKAMEITQPTLANIQAGQTSHDERHDEHPATSCRGDRRKEAWILWHGQVQLFHQNQLNQNPTENAPHSPTFIQISPDFTIISPSSPSLLMPPWARPSPLRPTRRCRRCCGCRRTGRWPWSAGRRWGSSGFRCVTSWRGKDLRDLISKSKSKVRMFMLKLLLSHCWNFAHQAIPFWR